MSDRSKKKHLLFQILRFLISIGLAVGLMELAAVLILKSDSIRSRLGIAERALDHKTLPIQIYSGLPCIQQEGYYLHKPGDYPRRQGDHHYTIHINSRGFRGREFTEKPIPHGTRIVCLGGSSTLGVESDDESTYPQFLERELNRNSPSQPAEVINGGFSNMSLREIVPLLEHEILRLEPDIVTLYSGINNMNRELDRQDRFKANRLMMKGKFVNRLYNWSGSFRIVNAIVWSLQFRNLRRTFGESELVEFQQHLHQVIDITRNHSIRLLLIKQPLALKGYPILQEAGRMKRIESSKQSGDVSREDLVWWFQSHLLERLEAAAAAKSVPVIDPVREFHEYENQVFVDTCHLTPEGNRRLAIAIAAGIQRISDPIP